MILCIIFIISFIILFQIFIILWDKEYNYKKELFEKNDFIVDSEESNDFIVDSEESNDFIVDSKESDNSIVDSEENIENIKHKEHNSIDNSDYNKIKLKDYSFESQNFSPQPFNFPTLKPRTKCENPDKPGTWVFIDDEKNDDENLKDDIDFEKIRQNRQNCIKEYPDFIQEVQQSALPSALSEMTLAMNEVKDFQEVIDPSTCVQNLAHEFPKLAKYCRLKNGNKPIDFEDLTQTFCFTGKYPTLSCVDPSNFKQKDHNISCSDTSSYDNNMIEDIGLYFCDNASISCSPCKFDHLYFENQLHSGFLNRICKPNQTDCLNDGVNRDYNLIFNRGLDKDFYNNFDVDTSGR